jgi:hypothetical protein
MTFGGTIPPKRADGQCQISFVVSQALPFSGPQAYVWHWVHPPIISVDTDKILEGDTPVMLLRFWPRYYHE